MDSQDRNNIDLREYLRKSPYLTQNIKKFAPEHQIPVQFVQNKLPIDHGRTTISFSNSKNIFGQKNLKNFLQESCICYVCGEVKNAFNKCSYCGKVICNRCLVQCHNCQRFVCKIDSQEVYEHSCFVCYDCSRSS